MAEEETKTPVEEEAKQAFTANPDDAPIVVLAQYIRDVSFENPNTPDSIRSTGKNPNIDINIGMDARKIPDEQHDNMYETILSVQANAQRDGEQLFLLEIQYGMNVLVNKKIPEDNIHPILLIEVPQLLFPYLRQMVSTLTSQGGFPPLMLTPVDFQALYMQRYGAEISAAAKENAEN